MPEPHQTRASVVSWGGVSRFRSTLSLCCGTRNLGPPLLSKLLPLCRSVSSPPRACGPCGEPEAEGRGEQGSAESDSLCQSLSTEPLGAAKGSSWGSRRRERLGQGLLGLLLPTGPW